MTKKTILYIGNFMLPDKNAAAQRAVNNSKIFKILGYEVILVGVDPNLGGSSEPSISNYEGLTIRSYSYPARSSDWLSHILGNKKILTYINKIGKSLHSVICYNYPAIATYRIFKIAASYGAHTISDITEWYDTNFQNIRNTVKALDTYARMRFVCPSSDGIITASRYMYNFYNKKRNVGVCIPTVYDTELIDSLNFTYAGASDKRTFVYAGSPCSNHSLNVCFNKDRLDLIVESFLQLDLNHEKYKLLVYGVDEKGYRTAVPMHNDFLDSDKSNVIFCGRKSRVEILKAFTEADFTIFLRSNNRLVLAGFPSKFSESVSCGTPIICSAISNLQSYMFEGQNSLKVDTLDLDHIKKAINNAINLPNDKVNSMHLSCRNSKQFDYKKYKNDFISFFMELENN